MVEANLQTTTALANFKAIEIDVANRFGSGIKGFAEAIGISRLMPVQEGFSVTLLKAPKVILANGTVAEGEIIPLSHVTPEVAEKKVIALKKYRKATTGEAIQRYGFDNAINVTDEALIKSVNKDIRTDLFKVIQNGSAKTNLKSGTLQGALATAWGALNTIFEDDAVATVVFANPEDVAKQIAEKNITLENQFGLNYYTDATGTTTFVMPQVAKGTIYATVPENLIIAYVDPTQSDLAQAFTLTTDEYGFVGIKHFQNEETLTHQTLVVSGVSIFPEYLDGVVKVEIGIAGA